MSRKHLHRFSSRSLLRLPLLLFHYHYFSCYRNDNDEPASTGLTINNEGHDSIKINSHDVMIAFFLPVFLDFITAIRKVC